MADDASTTDLIRRLENLVRAGTIAAVDHARSRCRVASGNLLTDFLPWFEQRAGDVRTWSPPSVGEQCVILCPGGDMASAVVLVGIPSDTHPAPADSPTLERRLYADGAVIDYDHAAHALTVVLPAGGTADITAPASIVVRAQHITLDAPESLTTGNLTVEGTVQATVDVRAAAISLRSHVHTGVRAGGDLSGMPQQ